MFNISPRVRRDIAGFYTAKHLKGQTFKKHEILTHFNYEKNHFNSKFFRFISEPPPAIGDGFKVEECRLVHRRYALKFLNKHNLWLLNLRHLTGTDLYVYYNYDKIPFWKDPKYGRESTLLPSDIESKHISRRIKNRSQVILFLNMTKRTYQAPIQLKLFE